MRHYAPHYRVAINGPDGKPIASIGGLDRAAAIRQVRHEHRQGNRVRVWLVSQTERRDVTKELAP